MHVTQTTASDRCLTSKTMNSYRNSVVTDAWLVAARAIHCVYTACVVDKSTAGRVTSNDLVASSALVSICVCVDVAETTRLVTIRCMPPTGWANYGAYESIPHAKLSTQDYAM